MSAAVTRDRLTMLGLAAAAALLAAALVIARPANPSATDEIARLRAEIADLRREQRLSPLLLARYRGSICFLHGTYRYLAPGGVRMQVRYSGTAFAVAPQILATNRHVIEPWFETGADRTLPRGHDYQRETLAAFCPGRAEPLPVTVRAKSDADVALLAYDGPALPVIPLAARAPAPGEPVVVVGYPMGITAMVAKSPSQVFRRLAHRERDERTAQELAELRLIRPSATHGHLGDVIGDRLIYDAATAEGGSGGPVLNQRGEVIAINAAYIDGFAGGTLGVSVEALRPLLAEIK